MKNQGKTGRRMVDGFGRKSILPAYGAAVCGDHDPGCRETDQRQICAG